MSSTEASQYRTSLLPPGDGLSDGQDVDSILDLAGLLDQVYDPVTDRLDRVRQSLLDLIEDRPSFLCWSMCCIQMGNVFGQP